MSVAAWACYVINLARQPERWRVFRKLNGDVGLRLERFDAVEGKDVDLAALVASGQLSPAARIAPGMLGAALSHRALWLRCIESGAPIIVFEDDVRLRRDFVEKLDAVLARVPGFDIVSLGFNTDHPVNIRIVADADTMCSFSVKYPSPAQMDAFAAQTDWPAAVRLRGQFGSCAYVMSPAGAARYLARCFPLENRMFEFATGMRPYRAFSLDGVKNTVYRHTEAFVCWPPLALSPNDQRMSATSGAAAARY
ncbi:glycosyltransferase family 25 protein [Ancylobacter terrae]|uniref:glycosyltransferase family 25 protein n=1 Tax=Ancylobacter sp. sgz301288 TaxID=3342077 RepID=UPI0038588304